MNIVLEGGGEKKERAFLRNFWQRRHISLVNCCYLQSYGTIMGWNMAVEGPILTVNYG